MNGQSKPTQWTPFQAIFDPSFDIAFIQLNCGIGTELKQYTDIWHKAKLRAATDGAVNRLYTSPHLVTEQYLPDFISGDFDSADSDVLSYYRQKGCEIIFTPDQDETDFTKCLRILTDRIKSQNIQVCALVVYGSHAGDRFDHIMGNIQTLFKAHTMTNLPLYLVSNASVEFLLPKGDHVIDVSCIERRGHWCGLIPIGCSCDHVTTTGLKWNLNNEPLSFGGLVSTSNTWGEGTTHVLVRTDGPLLCTMGLQFS